VSCHGSDGVSGFGSGAAIGGSAFGSSMRGFGASRKAIRKYGDTLSPGWVRLVIISSFVEEARICRCREHARGQRLLQAAALVGNFVKLRLGTDK